MARSFVSPLGACALAALVFTGILVLFTVLSIVLDSRPSVLDTYSTTTSAYVASFFSVVHSCLSALVSRVGTHCSPLLGSLAVTQRRLSSFPTLFGSYINTALLRLFSAIDPWLPAPPIQFCVNGRGIRCGVMARRPGIDELALRFVDSVIASTSSWFDRLVDLFSTYISRHPEGIEGIPPPPPPIQYCVKGRVIRCGPMAKLETIDEWANRISLSLVVTISLWSDSLVNFVLTFLCRFSALQWLVAGLSALLILGILWMHLVVYPSFNPLPAGEEPRPLFKLRQYAILVRHKLRSICHWFWHNLLRGVLTDPTFFCLAHRSLLSEPRSVTAPSVSSEEDTLCHDIGGILLSGTELVSAMYAPLNTLAVRIFAAVPTPSLVRAVLYVVLGVAFVLNFLMGLVAVSAYSKYRSIEELSNTMVEVRVDVNEVQAPLEIQDLEAIPNPAPSPLDEGDHDEPAIVDDGLDGFANDGDEQGMGAEDHVLHDSVDESPSDNIVPQGIDRTVWAVEIANDTYDVFSDPSADSIFGTLFGDGVDCATICDSFHVADDIFSDLSSGSVFGALFDDGPDPVAICDSCHALPFLDLDEAELRDEILAGVIPRAARCLDGDHGRDKEQVSPSGLATLCGVDSTPDSDVQYLGASNGIAAGRPRSAPDASYDIFSEADSSSALSWLFDSDSVSGAPCAGQLAIDGLAPSENGISDLESAASHSSISQAPERLDTVAAGSSFASLCPAAEVSHDIFLCTGSTSILGGIFDLDPAPGTLCAAEGTEDTPDSSSDVLTDSKDSSKPATRLHSPNPSGASNSGDEAVHYSTEGSAIPDDASSAGIRIEECDTSEGGGDSENTITQEAPLQSDPAISSFNSIESDELGSLVAPITDSIPAPVIVDDASHYSSRFLAGHRIDTVFLEHYELTPEEVDADHVGFTLVGRNRRYGHWVCVRFVCAAMVPANSWIDDNGHIPLEVWLARNDLHDNITFAECVTGDDAYFYLVYDLGVPLYHFIATEEYKQNRAELARYIFRGVASAVEALHANDIAHGDIRVDNIRITQFGEVTLRGFHVAKQCTRHGALAVYDAEEYGGSLLHAPLEILGEDAKRYSPRAADIFCLGLVLLELLTGEQPVAHVQDPRGWRIEDFETPLAEFMDDVGSLLARIFGRNNSRAKIMEVMAHPWVEERDNYARRESSGSTTSPTSLQLYRPGVIQDTDIPVGTTLEPVNPRDVFPQFPEDHVLDPRFVRNYTPGKVLGQGGYGFVIKAAHRSRKFEAAVKFIRKDCVHSWATEDDSVHGRLPLEVKIMTVAMHENVARCLDVFQDETHFYIGVELHGSRWDWRGYGADGQGGNSLYDFLLQEGPCSEDRARYIFGQLVEALNYLYGQGIGHGDIKPLNVLIDDNLKVKLIDYGNSVYDKGERDKLYNSRQFYCTLAYAPPEVWTSSEITYGPADVWSMGVLLFELLVGELPFADDQGTVDIQVSVSDAGQRRWESCSTEVVSLIKSVCWPREPVVRGTIREVRKHAWLSGWETAARMIEAVKSLKEQK